MAYIGNAPGVSSQRTVSTFTATSGQTTFTPSSGYTPGYIDVYQNGVKLIIGEDYTASNGTTVVLTAAASADDVVECVAYLPRGLSDGYTKAEADARYMSINEETLPSQTGQSGKYLTTDGTDPSWSTIAQPTPTSVSDQNNTSTGYFDLPAGTTAQRPASPQAGNIRFNTTTSLAEYYDGSAWKQLDSPPLVTSISPTTTTTANEEITINGLFFASGATVKFVGSDATEYNSPVVTFVSSTQITAQTPSTYLPAGKEPYSILVTNPSGLSGNLSDALDAGSTPTWTTSSGQLVPSVLYEGEILQNTTLQASDPDGTSVSFSLASGSNLPSGLSLNSSTGVISGAPSAVSSDTNTSFAVLANSASDSTSRTFQINVTDDESAAYEPNLKLWLRAGWNGQSTGNKEGQTLPAAKYASSYDQSGVVRVINSMVIDSSNQNSSPVSSSKFILDAQGGVSGLNTLAKQKDQYAYMCDGGDSFWLPLPTDNSVFAGNSGNHTICYWIMWEDRSANTSGNVFSPTFHSWSGNGNGNAFVAHDWYTNGTGNVYLQHYANSAGQGSWTTPNISGGSNGNKGVWFHIGITYTNGAIAIYLNGVSQSHSLSNTGTWPSIGSGQTVNFNGRGDGTSGGLPGTYATGNAGYKMQADLRYYNTPLSAGAIADIYNKTRSSFA